MQSGSIVPTSSTSGNVLCKVKPGGIPLVDGYAIGVIAFLALSVIVGTLASKFVKKSAKGLWSLARVCLFSSWGLCSLSIYRW